jgi:hypothetical protein
MGFEGANQMSNNRKAVRLGVAGLAALGAVAALGGCKAASVSSGAAPQDSGSQAVVVTVPASTAAATPSAAASSAAAAAPTTASAGSSLTCTGAQLSVKETSPDASLGHRAYVFVFTNKGAATCTLHGYPGASVTDTTGKVVADAQRTLVGYESGPTTITTVTLAPGASASAVVEWDAAADAGAVCPGTKGGHLLVTPPNTTVSTGFALPNDLCSDFQVHPVLPGTSGRANS